MGALDFLQVFKAPGRPGGEGSEQGRDQSRYCVVGVGINIAPPVADGLSTAPLGLQDLQSGNGKGTGCHFGNHQVRCAKRGA